MTKPELCRMGYQLPTVGQFGDEETPTESMEVGPSTMNGMILIYSHLNPPPPPPAEDTFEG